MNLFDEIDRKYNERIRIMNEEMAENKRKDVEKANVTPCDNCGDKPAYAVFYDSSLNMLQFPSGFRGNLCDKCEKEFKERYCMEW